MFQACDVAILDNIPAIDDDDALQSYLQDFGLSKIKKLAKADSQTSGSRAMGLGGEEDARPSCRAPEFGRQNCWRRTMVAFKSIMDRCPSFDFLEVVFWHY